MKTIIWLDSIDENDTSSAGIRAVEVAKLINNGVNVPEGFVVTSQTFGIFLKETGIGKRIFSLIENVDINNTSALNSCSQSIKDLFIRTRIPWYIEVDLLSAYKKFSKDAGFTDEYVTVIPSRLMPDAMDDAEEDEETYVDVLGKSELFDVIKRCWASQYTPRQIIKMKTTNIPFDTPQMAILVQRVVSSDISGIAFTVEPLSGKEVVQIQAVRGLVDAITEEGLKPDIYTVNRKTFEIIDKKMTPQTWMLVRNESGDYEKIDISEKEREAQKLSDEKIVELAKLAMKVEETIKSPVEVEWAQEGKRLYIETIERIELPKKDTKGTHEFEKKEKEKMAEEKKDEKKEEKKEQVIEITPSVAYAASNLGQHPVVSAVTTKSESEKIEKKISENTIQEELIEESKVREIDTEYLGKEEQHPVAPVVEVVDYSKKEETTKKEETKQITEKVEVKEPAKKEESVKILREYIPITSTKIHYIYPDGKDEKDAIIHIPKIAFVSTGSIYQLTGIHPNALLEEKEKVVDVLYQHINKAFDRFDKVVVETCSLTSTQLRMLKFGEKHEPRELNPLLGQRGVSRYRRKDGELLFRAEIKAIKKCIENGKIVDIALPFVRIPNDIEYALQIMRSEGLEKTEKNEKLKLYLSEITPAVILNAPAFAKICDGFIADLDCLNQVVMACEDESEALRNIGYCERSNDATWNALILLAKAAKEISKPIWIKAKTFTRPKDWVIDELIRSGVEAFCISNSDFKHWLGCIAESESRLIREKIKHN
ncbi:MAG: PEP/pyruvate-binding domain-containing protein [Thermoplasmata archaeon]